MASCHLHQCASNGLGAFPKAGCCLELGFIPRKYVATSISRMFLKTFWNHKSYISKNEETPFWLQNFKKQKSFACCFTKPNWVSSNSSVQSRIIVARVLHRCYWKQLATDRENCKICTFLHQISKSFFACARCDSRPTSDKRAWRWCHWVLDERTV